MLEKSQFINFDAYFLHTGWRNNNLNCSICPSHVNDYQIDKDVYLQLLVCVKLSDTNYAKGQLFIRIVKNNIISVAYEV